MKKFGKIRRVEVGRERRFCVCQNEAFIVKGSKGESERDSECVIRRKAEQGGKRDGGIG